jgi:DNA-binding transcriptional ArsR family regulator
VDDTVPTEEAVAVFDLLGDPERNRVLRILRRRGTPVSLDRVANLVESDESVGSGDDPAARGENQSAAELHHVHLPKLDDAGVIRYDREDRVVTALNEERLNSLLSTGQELLDSLER